MLSRKLRSICVLLLSLFVLSLANGRAAQRPVPAPVKQGIGASKKQSKERADPTAGENPYREDFASLSIKGSSLKLELAVLGEIDDKPGLPFIRERWHLEWRPGDPIDVYIVRPRGVEKPPVILYLYSYPQDTDRFKQDAWCGYVTGNEFAAVGFVSALTGHRLEHRAPKDSFFTEFQEALGASVHDVQMILNFLQSRKDLDLSRIGMFGQGSGGAIAILASATDSRIKALDVLTPWGDWPTFVATSTFIPSENRFALNTPDSLAKVAPLEPVKWLPVIKARNVRIQNVRKDGHMPDAAQEHMEAVAKESTEINQYGDPAALVPQARGGRLLDWIKAQLQPDAKPQVAMEKSLRIHFYPPKMPTASPLGEPH